MEILVKIIRAFFGLCAVDFVALNKWGLKVVVLDMGREFSLGLVLACGCFSRSYGCIKRSPVKISLLRIRPHRPRRAHHQTIGPDVRSIGNCAADG